MHKWEVKHSGDLSAYQAEISVHIIVYYVHCIHCVQWRHRTRTEVEGQGREAGKKGRAKAKRGKIQNK